MSWKPEVVEGGKPEAEKGKLIFVLLNTLSVVQRVRLPPDALVVADKLCGHCHGSGRWAGRECPCLKVMVTPYKTKVKDTPGLPLRRAILPDLGQPENPKQEKE